MNIIVDFSDFNMKNIDMKIKYNRIETEINKLLSEIPIKLFVNNIIRPITISSDNTCLLELSLAHILSLI